MRHFLPCPDNFPKFESSAFVTLVFITTGEPLSITVDCNRRARGSWITKN